MSNLINAEEFGNELLEALHTFKENVNDLTVRDVTFPEWYELFGKWLEVGTDVEEQHYGKRKVNKKEDADRRI